MYLHATVVAWPADHSLKNYILFSKFLMSNHTEYAAEISFSSNLNLNKI